MMLKSSQNDPNDRLSFYRSNISHFVFTAIFTTFGTDVLNAPRLKKLACILVIIQLFLLLPQHASAQFQPAEVVRSQEKTIVNGKIYFIHTVRKGQTLYSISRAYEVTQDDIMRNNPGIDPASLREGLALKIPETVAKQAALYPENKEDFISHTVKRGQTVYSLTRKYDVTEEIIYFYNPWAREGIKPDQTVWIPRKRELRNRHEYTEIDNLFNYHTVKENDTLYAISRQYGVTVADIITNNPELRDGIKTGQVLKIPKVVIPDPDLVVTDSLQFAVNPCQVIDQVRTYNVAMLLPFFAEYIIEEALVPVDTLAEEGTYVPQQKQQGLRGRNFSEFYEGFLLALDSMKSTGLSVNLHVFDTERDTLKLKRIVRELSVVQPDLIIGPVYSEDVKIAGQLARYQDFNLVSPLSTRPSLVNGNSRIFQVIPTTAAESNGLAGYLSQFRKGRFILIRGTDSISMHDSWRFKRQFTGLLPSDANGNLLPFNDYLLNDSLISILSHVLSQDEENIIIVFSDNEPDVSRLITRLFMMSQLYPIKLFGLPSWQSWRTIELNYFHSLQLHLITPFYTDYSDPQVKRFLHKCRSTYGYEPYEISPRGYNFVMLGYDIGLYFLSALKQYGREFQYCLSQVDADLLLSNYNFVQEGEGGFSNSSFNLIRYNTDYTVVNTAIINGSVSGNGTWQVQLP